MLSGEELSGLSSLPLLSSGKGSLQTLAPALITHFRRAFIISGQREGNKRARGQQADTSTRKMKARRELSGAAIPNVATGSCVASCISIGAGIAQSLNIVIKLVPGKRTF